MTYLIQYDDRRARDPGVVGKKFASLADAAQKGFSVPHGAVICTDAHQYFLKHKRWPPGLIEEVVAYANGLGWQSGLSIRSSAVREDLDSQSFAGQYLTFLRVAHPEELSFKIEKCWLSAEAETVRSYLQAHRTIDPEAGIPLMGVILQRMVDAMAAGVAFGRNPVNPVKDEMVIEAVSGSGEKLMNGHVSPDRAYISRNGRIRIECHPGSRSHTRENVDVPLAKADWRRIAELLNQLESAIGKQPLDMEWAIDDARQPWLLQYRTITTLGKNDLDVPPGMWTRRIADDLWADRLTPLLADTMVKTSPRFDHSETLRLLKIPVVEPTLTVINGYLYVNCESLKQVIACVPESLITSDMRAFFPADFDFQTLKKPGALGMVKIGLRMLLLPIRQPAVNPVICLWQARRERTKIEHRLSRIRRMPATTLEEAHRKMQGALQTMTLIQENNQWPYFHAAFFTLLLRWITVDRCGAPHADFLNLISSGGRNISIDIERHFRRMAEKVLSDPELTTLFLNRNPTSIINDLPAEFSNTLKRFLHRFGCRSRHRTLYIRRWSEAPEEVIGILQALVRQADENNRDAAREKVDFGRQGCRSPRAGHRMQADHHRLQTALNPPAISGHTIRLCRLAQPVFQKLARRFLDLREDLRFLLDKALYDIRQTLLHLGEVSGLGAGIMFLYGNEIEALVSGSLDATQAGELAAKRHRRFLKPAISSTFYIDGRPLEKFSMSSTVLQGIGTSSGQASGPARIIVDPSHDRINKGDIIIAQNTDPGWTPILSLVAGMVMEEGGLLNHCSIVARELRIPAVVGIHQATRRIRDGTLITIDGGSGLVRIEDGEAKSFTSISTRLGIPTLDKHRQTIG